jgi:uncharacterized protein (DUF2062 family)
MSELFMPVLKPQFACSVILHLVFGCPFLQAFPAKDCSSVFCIKIG